MFTFIYIHTCMWVGCVQAPRPYLHADEITENPSALTTQADRWAKGNFVIVKRRCGISLSESEDTKPPAKLRRVKAYGQLMIINNIP